MTLPTYCLPSVICETTHGYVLSLSSSVVAGKVDLFPSFEGSAVILVKNTKIYENYGAHALYQQVKLKAKDMAIHKRTTNIEYLQLKHLKDGSSGLLVGSLLRALDESASPSQHTHGSVCIFPQALCCGYSDHKTLELNFLSLLSRAIRNTFWQIFNEAKIHLEFDPKPRTNNYLSPAILSILLGGSPPPTPGPSVHPSLLLCVPSPLNLHSRGVLVDSVQGASCGSYPNRSVPLALALRTIIRFLMVPFYRSHCLP